MRLDKYLKITRLIKRRTIANEACDAGKISVNGTVAKASYNVKEGDVLEITMGAKTLRAKVLSVPEYTKKEDASSHYEILE
jgi:ribosomal 50S subunit-recycling heat shock protein